MNSNPAQAEAIRHGEGPMLVLAGPGSGKTYVITRRVRHLIEQLNVHPDNILVITFSKAAADEMRQRFHNSGGASYPGVTFGTFHAVFFHILQTAYRIDSSHILREEQAKAILREILTDLSPELAEEPEMIAGIREEIQKYKGSLVPGAEPDDRSYEPLSCRRELFYPVLDRYLLLTKNRNLIDFEDMLSGTFALFRKHPDHLTFWQERYQYILVDEFQDINPLQYETVRLLAGAKRNLFAVGDDDQSIYGFRGSVPEIMLGFPKDYPDAKTVVLSVNYRCSEEILTAASDLINFNSDRYEKKLRSHNGPAGPVRFECFEHTALQYEAVTKQVSEWIAGGTNPSDIAVLFRTNLDMRGLLRCFEKNAIPFRCHTMPPSLYSNPYVSPVLSYLRLSAGGRERSDWFAVMNRPFRYVPRSAFPSKQVSLPEVYALLQKDRKDYVRDRLMKLEFDLKRIGRMNPYAAIHYIRHIIGYNAFLTDTLPDATAAADLLDEVMETAKEFRTIAEFLTYAEGEPARLRKNRTDDADTAHKPAVQVQTFHRSKGLEYRHVILCDCNELVTPHKKALLPEQIAEERRLFYVAMTRASVSLTLCYVKKRFSHEMMPSRFLGEIRLPAASLAPGLRISHERFGPGTVVSATGHSVTIRFDGSFFPKTLPLPLCRENGSLIAENYLSSPL